MHIRNAALARCRIAQMTHIQFACEGQMLLRIRRIREVFGGCFTKFALYPFKDFGNGIIAFCAFAKHIFVAGKCFKLHTRHTRSLLSAIMLLLHH